MYNLIKDKWKWRSGKSFETLFVRPWRKVSNWKWPSEHDGDQSAACIFVKLTTDVFRDEKLNSIYFEG